MVARGKRTAPSGNIGSGVVGGVLGIGVGVDVPDMLKR
jgi:hypothetical protein